MAIRKGCGLVDEKQMDLSSGVNDNVIASDIWRRGEKITRIVNVYNHRVAQSVERLAGT
jgi:hypothetical protein